MDDDSLYVVLKVYRQIYTGMRGHARERNFPGMFALYKLLLQQKESPF